MKLTKKDQIMLLILFTVMVVAIFFMYGIMPAQDKVKELDAQITEKQTKVQELNQVIAGLNVNVPKNAKKEALIYYYNNKDDIKYMHEVLIGTALDRYVSSKIDAHNIDDYSTVGWAKLNTVAVPHSFTSNAMPDPVEVMIERKVANLTISFKVKEKQDFYDLVDDFRDDPNFRVQTISLTVREKEKPAPELEPELTPDPAPTPVEPSKEDKFYPYEGSMMVEFVMGNKHVPTEDVVFPEELEDVTNLAVSTTSPDTLVFDHMENAESYELYTFTVDENGKRSYAKISNIVYKFNKDTGKDSIQIIQPTSGMQVCVVAIGDYTNYYKTLLDDETPFVTLV